MRNRRILGIGQLGRRLALAFVAVALAAIAVNSAISAETLGADMTHIVMQQEGGTAWAAATSSAAYDDAGWARADLSPAYDLARRAGAGLQLRDPAWRLVSSSPRFASFPAAHQRSLAVSRHGRLSPASTSPTSRR